MIALNYPDSINKKPNLWLVFYLLIILTALQLFIALLTNGFALSQEEAMWHYIGRNWFRHGLVPYSGGADNKSPLFFVIFGISDRFCGVNYWFPRVLGTMVQSAGTFFLYKIASHISGRRAGLLAMSLYGLSVLWHGVDGKYVSFTETYEVACIIISFYFFLTATNRTGYFISGLLTAIGLGFRLSAVFVIAAIFIAAVRKGGKLTFIFCLGLLSGILALALTGYLADINFHDILTCMVTDNFGPGSINSNDFLTRMVQFYNLFFYSEAILFYPLVLVYIFIKRKIDWMILWAFFVFVGINAIGNYARVDLKELLPAMSLMGGLGLAHLIDAYGISMRKVMFITWACFSPRLLEPFVNIGPLFTGEVQRPENFCHEPFNTPDEGASKQLGLWVKANTRPGEKVYVAGYGSQVQAYSERLSPTIYFNVTQTRVAKERLFSDMKKNRADMILVPLFPGYTQWVDADLRQYVDQLVAGNYYFERCLFSYSVYRLKRRKGFLSVG
ncbi:MAG: glycosyltransferase family 39 protein [Bacteroidota bacterium]|nr:glycosyltransferase family 39 protein [Bacteroidota bacterium]